MKLYGSYTSPFVRHCRIVLALNQQDYEFVPTDRAGSTAGSPTARVPFFEDGSVKLYDSASIIRYLREQYGESFCPTVTDYEEFCLVNTLVDTTVNVYLLQIDGLGPQQSAYLARQQTRIETLLAQFEQHELETNTPYSDAALRLGCYLSWAVFRGLLDITAYPNLQAFLAQLDGQPWFANTHPALG